MVFSENVLLIAKSGPMAELLLPGQQVRWLWIW